MYNKERVYAILRDWENQTINLIADSIETGK